MLSIEGAKVLKKVEKQVERRYDGDEGPFTREEFNEVYGGYTEWEAAATAKKTILGNAKLRHVQERRHDGDEGLFTKQDFYEMYGGYAEWEAAKKQVPTAPFLVETVALKATSVGEEKKQPSSRASVSFATNAKSTAKPVAKVEALDEKRIDASDGGAYTRAEFLGVYGNEDVWRTSSPYFHPGQEAEKRVDATDGREYTKTEFFDLYGNYDAWDASERNDTHEQLKVETGGVVEVEAEGEQRIDPTDGGSYTKEEYFEVYGDYEQWKVSKVDKAAMGVEELRADPTNGGAYTRAEFSEFYGSLGFVKWKNAKVVVKAKHTENPPTTTVKLKVEIPAWKLAQEKEKARRKSVVAPVSKKATPKAERAVAATVQEKVAAKKPPSFKVGQAVEGRFGGKAKYFAGTVTRVDEDTLSYDISYADGDVEAAVSNLSTQFT
jgi:hypothetical protein